MSNSNGQQILKTDDKQKTDKNPIKKHKVEKKPASASYDAINTEVDKLNTPGSAAQ